MSTEAKRPLANTRSKTETGFEYVMNQLQTYSAYGAKELRGFTPYMPGEEEALRARYDEMDLLLDFAGKESALTDEIIKCLWESKEMSLTLERSVNDTLSVVELFEVKTFLLRTGRIREILEELLVPAGVPMPERYKLYETTDLLDVLDPSKERMDTFYIYDSFSEELAALRKEKRDLDLELRKAQKAIRTRLEAAHGFHMTPKFELIVPKANKALLELASGLAELKRGEEDYMNVVFNLVPDERVCEINGRAEKLAALIEEAEDKVRVELTAAIAAKRSLLAHNCQIIGHIDVDLAKVLYAKSHGCIRPVIRKDHSIEIEDGRNLQVEDILKEKGKPYCPVSIHLKDGVTAITGANMGGKTISIKMTGQIALLTQYAMYVPAAKAEVGLSNFMQVLIGDSQNINRGLSSFGSEMEELKEILDNAQSRSIIIIDEIASGTNPAEGLALTRAFMSYFQKKDYITLFTTHFDHAAVGSDVCNLQVRGLAGADFDKLQRELSMANRRQRIEILGKYMDYRLQRVDGEACAPRDALNIAKILGVYAEIIDEAREYLL